MRADMKGYTTNADVKQLERDMYLKVTIALLGSVGTRHVP